MTAPRCTRCGDRFEPRQLGDRHCPRCVRETTQQPQDARWVAPWLRRLKAKDMTGYGRA